MQLFLPVLPALGLLLAILGVAELLPALYDYANDNDDWIVFAVAATGTMFVGTLLALAMPKDKRGLSIRQMFILTVGCWVVLTAFGAIPFQLSSLHLNMANAYFEAMSGITTTGATVIEGLDALPPGILLWRGELQWLGGLGIIVMAIAVLPGLGVGGMQMFKVEAFDTAGKVLPRATQISAALILVYIGLTAACAIAYYSAGMSGFDAMVHAMTTVATGGMSTHDASLGFFDSLTIELICILFMILGSLPFLLYVRTLQGEPLALLKDAQVRGFFIFAGAAVFLAFMAQATRGLEPGALELRDAAFSVVSVMTGTGYTTVDYSQWSVAAVALFFVVTFIGGCTGSTSCGIKIFRFQIVHEGLRLQTRRLIHPNQILVARYNGQRLDDHVIHSVMSFFFLFGLSFLLISIVLTLFGLDTLTAMSATATSMANVGPGLGDVVGPAHTFAGLSDGEKWVLSFAMLLGRLEVLSVLVLFLPRFWE